MSETATELMSPPVFLDVPVLLESSRPVRRINWFWYAVGAFVFFTLLGNLAAAKHPGASTAIDVVIFLIMAAAVLVGVGGSVLTVRRFRRQQHIVDSVDEMLQLRRWQPAGMLLDRMLASPVSSPRIWATSLVQLASLLGRYHRFEDAIAVQDFIVDNELLDDAGDYMVRLSRAMAMLREDHLVDADRAISDLRRRGGAGNTGISGMSGGLALVEMFRDVKTGHPDEAIDIFEKHQLKMRQELGHRMADAYGLLAKAFDLLGQTDQAKLAYQRATLLAPAEELNRRYPELATLAVKYPATLAPVISAPAISAPLISAPAVSAMGAN